LNKKEIRWGLFIGILIFFAYFIPYTVLSDVAKWYGSFLFWSILAILTIFANYMLTKEWSEEE